MNAFFKSTFLVLTWGLMLGQLSAQPISIGAYQCYRGHFPEHSLAGIEASLEAGLRAIHMSVVPSRDQHLVLSEKAFISPAICMDSTGLVIHRDREEDYRIYAMSLEEVQKFNCGIKPNTAFPKQKRMRSYKPGLPEAIAVVQNFQYEQKAQAPLLLIEAKSWEEGDKQWHPQPKEYAILLLKEFKKLKLSLDDFMILSEDPRLLNQIHQIFPAVSLGYKVENTQSPEVNLKQLEFTPEAYVCQYQMLTLTTSQWLREQGVKVISFAVNDQEQWKRIQKYKPYLILSDYPEALAD